MDATLHSAGAEHPSAAPRPLRARPRLAWSIAAGALLLDVLVTVPFVYDPYGWREPTFAAPGASERTDYVIFLAVPVESPWQADFLTRHPGLRVEHTGGLGDTVVVSLPAPLEGRVAQVRADPLVRLMMPGVAGLCRAT